MWHLFGITHPEPAAPLDEKFFAHATSESLSGTWEKQEYVLHADPEFGETHVWAPFIIKHDQKYFMYYCGGGEDHTRYQIRAAVSKNLWNWERLPKPCIIDGFDARDPMVLKRGNKWIMYYSATSQPTGGHHVVKAATSHDLINWNPFGEVCTHQMTGTFGGPTESPHVMKYKDKYLLFLSVNIPYRYSEVYISDNPFHWDIYNKVGEFNAHAPEIIQDTDSKYYISHCGWGEGGVYLAPLYF